MTIRVLIVDDSAVVRGLIARALESDSEIRVVGTAIHGEAALTFLRRAPADVVILDVEMPVMDGLTALRAIQAEFPATRVIMASSLTHSGADTTCRALALGAASCIAKPVTSNVSSSIDAVMRDLVPVIKALGAKVAKAVPAYLPRTTSAVRRPSRELPEALFIGSSTGGPQALRSVLCDLPRDFPLPIFIAQHMPPLFTPLLAKHLTTDTGRPCQEATHLGTVEAGRTYVAPGDFHLEVVRRNGKVMTVLTQDAPEHYCRPSVNPLFRSAARVYRSATLALMLTGMGEDGLEGSRTLVEQGGQLIAQDEATSVVWGMPGAVVRAGLADEVLPLGEIGGFVLRRCLQEAFT